MKSVIRPSCNNWMLLLLSLIIVVALFFLQGSVGFNLADEGYLWYGAQRVILGEVPILDFMAYDPGRYYWSAAFMSLWGDNGIMALRASVAIFQLIGLFVGLSLVAHATKPANFFYILCSVLILVVWMFPRHKLFDISIAIFLVAALSFLIENPTNRRFFLTGLFVGLIAVFGRNHGVYGVIGSIGVIAWLGVRRFEWAGLLNGLGLWLAGMVIGFSPIIFMMFFVPNFATAFLESIRFLFEIGATNLPLPVPWPWSVNFSEAPFGVALRGVLIGLFFIALVIFCVLSIAWVVWRRLNNKPVPPALVAASFLGFTLCPICLFSC